MGNYRHRIADALLDRKLESAGAVVIEGAKWCGKTSTAEQKAQSTVFLSDTSHTDYLQMAELNAALVLEGATPRLLDEWQLAPKLWDAVRHAVDQRQEMGQFIMTGSAVPANLDKIRHTGTGRMAWLTMRPMSLWESGDSSGKVSLKALFEGAEQIGEAGEELELEHVAYLTCRGGWPMVTHLRQDAAADVAFNYLDGVIHSDVQRVDGVSRDADRVKRLLKIYARAQGTQTTLAKLLKDMQENDLSCSENTLLSYLSALRKIFVIEDMTAWNPNLRSRTAVRTASTRYFVDPSIATASLGLGSKDLINDLNTFGLLFETLCIRDLRVYAQAVNGEVYHYRDKNGLECDAVVHLRNGQYGLVEIKLGGERLIEEGASSLRTLAEKIDTTKMPKPSFLAILTATGQYAYTRPDGVHVIPVYMLKD
ncbi:MAG: DUF4143 domain-containing protein [Bacteroidales bacterium]|nr:DUF4143 domain-containing protein [Bacteroidales bacterium]